MIDDLMAVGLTLLVLFGLFLAAAGITWLVQSILKED